MMFSFSNLNCFLNCERQWFYKYVSKPPFSDKVEEKYGAFGRVVHNSLEHINNFNSPKEAVNKYWIDEGETIDGMSVLAAYECVERSISHGFKIKHREEKIYFDFNGHKFIAIIDCVLEDNTIVDYKTSTWDVKKMEEYKRQVLFYSWVYYRVKNILPPKGIIDFNKKQKKGNYIPLQEFSFSEQDILDFEAKIKAQMDLILSKGAFENFKVNRTPKACFFCGWKKRCWADDTSKLKDYKIKITLGHKNLLLQSEQHDPVLENVLESEFMYELDNAYFAIKAMRAKGNKTFDGKIRLYKNGVAPVAFKERIKELLKDYKKHLEVKGKRLILQIVDSREFPKVTIDMPEQLNGITIRDYQKIAIDKIIHEKFFFGEICTGAGKTIMAAELIRKVAKKTIFVVDVKDLLKQTQNSFEKLLGKKCGLITAGKQEWSEVNLATIQTVSKFLKKKDREFIKNLHECNVVIIDEAHAVKAKSYKKMMDNIKAEYRIGLTGTAYADGNASLELYSAFGFVNYKITLMELIESGHLMMPEIKFIDYPEPNIIYGTWQEQYEQVLSSEERINEVSTIVKKHADKDYILIVTRHLKHAYALVEEIESQGYVCALIEGATKDKDREIIYDAMRSGDLHIIIGTDKIVQKGLDIPRLNVGINYVGNLGSILTRQFLGRIVRNHPDKKESTFYDFNDTVYDLKNHTKNRVITLEKEGFTVQKQQAL